ncbi:MAG: protein-disulfide isomerase [Acidimicrobiaceae bacterium]|nr:protein-disulfide isomerase [Acidimicrobiaceae bacterium]
MKPFQLTYDYRCPFAKNIHLHVVSALRGGHEIPVSFVPWTMSQGHRSEGAPDVWEDPAYDGAHQALVTSISVRDRQPDHFLAVHEALYRARHEDGRRLHDPAEIAEILAPLGVDVDDVGEDVSSRRPYRVLGDSFREMEAYEVFGVPTFVLDKDATFVRFMRPPSGDAAESAEIITSLVTLMEHSPDLNEFKHTRVPF